MDEKRTGINKLVPIELLPFVGTGPGTITLLRKRKSRRRQTKDVQDECLAVTGPPVLEESRFGFPTMRDCKTAIPGPLPIGTSVKRFGQLANLTLVFSLPVEIQRTGKRACQQVCRIDGRYFRFPNTLAGLHIEKVIVETSVTNRVRTSSLFPIVEESQTHQRAPDRISSTEITALNPDRIGCKSEPNHGDRTRRSLTRVVRNETVLLVHFLGKVFKRVALKLS